jgi:predicted negative regulator of RcsB-dependent stress response
MQMFLLLFLILAIVAYVGYTTYQSNARRRAIEKKRNQYHDRV